jgi:hypothetical protein
VTVEGNDYQITDKAYGPTAKNRIDMKVIEDGWDSTNEVTQAYIDANTA